MSIAISTDPRYPIGQYEPQPFSEKQKINWLTDLSFLPKDIEMAVLNLDEAQLQTPYREGGWTVHQLVHHVADSHMHAYLRFKFALTEDNPTIKPYNEGEWAKLNDVLIEPVNISITLLFALHARWVSAIKDLDEETFLAKSVFHPQHQRKLSLWHLLGMYVWHGRHHVAHIRALREARGWN